MKAKCLWILFLLVYGLLLAAQDAESAMLYAPAELKSPPAGDTRAYVESRDQEVRAKLEAIDPDTGSDGVEVSPCGYVVTGKKRPDLITVSMMLAGLPFGDEALPQDLIDRGFNPKEMDTLLRVVDERSRNSPEWTLTKAYLKEMGFSDLFQLSPEELNAQPEKRLLSYYAHLFRNLRKEENNTAILILNALSSHSRRVLLSYAIETVTLATGTYSYSVEDCPDRVSWNHSFWVH